MSDHHQLTNETTKVEHFQDLEAGQGMQGGASLARSMSVSPSHALAASTPRTSLTARFPPHQVQLTPEQFERLYLQPGGVAAKGDLAKRVGNPCVDSPHLSQPARIRL